MSFRETPFHAKAVIARTAAPRAIGTFNFIDTEVEVDVGVGVEVEVEVGVGVEVDVEVGVGVEVEVDVGVGVEVEVDVAAGVEVEVDVGVAVTGGQAVLAGAPVMMQPSVRSASRMNVVIWEVPLKVMMELPGAGPVSRSRWMMASVNAALLYLTTKRSQWEPLVLFTW